MESNGQKKISSGSSNKLIEDFTKAKEFTNTRSRGLGDAHRKFYSTQLLPNAETVLVILME